MGKKNRATLTAEAEALGITVEDGWTNKVIQDAIDTTKEALSTSPGEDTTLVGIETVLDRIQGGVAQDTEPTENLNPQGEDEVGSHDAPLVRVRGTRRPGVLRLPHRGHIWL